MTWIDEPTVTLIGRPKFIHPPHLPVEFCGPNSTDGELLAEYAGRVCYMSQANPAKRTTADYLANILKQGHGSVLEHAVYVLLIEGISRSCSHELVRHRAGFGYSQLSQRYVDESDTAFVIPPALLDGRWEAVSHRSLLDEWKDEMAWAREIYHNTVERLMQKYAHVEDRTHRRKLAREAARSVLPNATETKIVVSANARAWRTMLELRTGEGADQEIRRMALKCLEVLRNTAPAFFQDFEVYETQDGLTAARVTHHKV